MWFSYLDKEGDDAYPLKVDKVNEILSLNREGKKAASIAREPKEKVIDFKSAAGEDSITRFDEVKRKKNNSRNRFKQRRSK